MCIQPYHNKGCFYSLLKVCVERNFSIICDRLHQNFWLVPYYAYTDLDLRKIFGGYSSYTG